MPTECERSVNAPAEQRAAEAAAAEQLQQDLNDTMESKDMLNGEMSTSQTSNTSSTASNGHNGSATGQGGKKVSITSPDPTSYVTKARVTRPTPPPPSYNPMQFVQIKPCNLYQTAQQQLKKAEEVKKIKEIIKEEPEDWQNNLDSWKSSRRKRVEHIIDRVVEVKKLELEEHDRSRRKSKTFSEMIEERGERPGPRRAKLASLAVYNEEETNDLSDLGIGNSSASGKSSLSEDYDNNSVMSDNVVELDKAILEQNHKPSSTTREYISSPGYDTSSSTAPASSPDPCEYTYEGAIQDYKQRVSRATSGNVVTTTSTTNINMGNSYKLNNGNHTMKAATSSSANSKESTPERLNNGAATTETYPTRRGSKIEDRLMGFEVSSPSDSQEGVEKHKVDVPKIDISKRKEMFENQHANNNNNEPKSVAGAAAGVPKVTLRDRFKLAQATSASAGGNAETQEATKKQVKRLSGDVTSIRDRLHSLEQQQHATSATNAAKVVDIPVPPLKDRLSSLQNAVTKEEVRKPPVALVDARQLEIMKNEEQTAQQRKKQLEKTTAADNDIVMVQTEVEIIRRTDELLPQMDPDDSGIHTSDDIEVEERMVEQLQEQQLNAAIAALAMEEQQLEQAANAVNQIEAEFAELSSHSAAARNTSTTTTTTTTATIVSATNEQPCEMEFSINEALELALQAIDKETNKIAHNNNENIKEQSQNAAIEIRQTEIIPNQNKTDEEKEIKSKTQIHSKQQQMITVTQQQQQMQVINNNNKHKNMPNVDELKIAMEPIYENISTTSTCEVDVDTRIIPNTNSNNNNSNSNNNNNNNSNINTCNNNNNIKLNNNNNSNNFNSNNLVELTNAFANTNNITTTTTKTITATNVNRTAAATSQQNEITAIQKTITTTAAATTTATPTPTPTSTALLNMPNEQQPQQPTKSTAPPPQQQQQLHSITAASIEPEPYYQVPKSSEPYYDAPKHLRPIPLYENIDIFYNGLENSTLATPSGATFNTLEPPKEKPPPPPTESPPPFDDVDSVENGDTWSSDNTYETISSRLTQHALAGEHPSPPIKRMNSTKRIKKELRNKRSSFLGIEGSLDDDESYLELTVAPPPDMAQLLQEERRLEKQLYMKAGLCDSSDTGESRDSGVSENHSRQSSEHYTNSSEENDHHIESPTQMSPQPNPVMYQTDSLLTAAQTPLLQTVKGNSAESWTESATVAAAATKSLTEATATANAKMHSIEEKIREQEEVLRVERELLQLEQEELKRQRENLMLRENMARRELQHGAKMLMSANRHSLQDLNGLGMSMAAVAGGSAFGQPALPHQLTQQQQQQLAAQLPHQAVQMLPPQQIYANVPNLQQQYYQVDTDYRKSMSDLNEFSKRLMLPPTPPTKPMRASHLSTTTTPPTPAPANAQDDFAARQRHSLNTQSYGGSLVKIATPTAAPRGHIYSNYHHQSAQNLSNLPLANAPANMSHANNNAQNGNNALSLLQPGNMSRNTLHALSATPKPKYTDGWVQVQNRKSYDSANLANDPAWLSAYQQKRKSMPDAYHAYNNNHWLVQEAEQRRIVEQQQHRSISNGNTPVHQQNGGVGKASQMVTANSNGKPLPDSIIQTLTERVQSKGIGERKRFENYNDKNLLHAASYQQQQQYQQQSNVVYRHANNDFNSAALPPTVSKQLPASTCNVVATAAGAATAQDKVLSVSGKKKCSHCGDELGRGAAMIIESLLLFYHINCFKCCVCHVQLGDGLNGTDVRVRNHKLHCQNCYSSDDGIKFSCV